MLPKVVTELTGTFFLVLVIGLTAGAGSPLAPIAIGCALMVIVYMGGHISGGHYNPAVSLALLLRGALPARDLLPYWAAQLSGGLLAGAATGFLLGKPLAVAPGVGVAASQALGIEVLFTFLLASVVLNVATSKDHPNNSFYGLAIGFTLLTAAVAGGGISGGAYNPAVSIGHNVFSGALGVSWIHVVGPMAGGVLAAGLFRINNPGEFKG